METHCQAQCSSACRQGIVEKTEDHQSTSSSSSPPGSATSANRLPSRNVIRRAWKDFKLGCKIPKQESIFDLRKKPEIDIKQPKLPTYGLGWQFRWDKEYPWRIDCPIPGDENWKGTWVLEVKDISEVNWTWQEVHNGREWKEVILPDAPYWHNPPTN